MHCHWVVLLLVLLGALVHVRADEETVECLVRMNGQCYEDLAEAVHELNLGRQAGKPSTPPEATGTNKKSEWSKKRIVIELKSGTKWPGSVYIRPDRDLKSLFITTVGGEKRAIIDCEKDGKPGLIFENRINTSLVDMLDIRHCTPGIHYTPSYEGNLLRIDRCHLMGNLPNAERAMSVFIDSDKNFDHPSNGQPLRYTDEEIFKEWHTKTQGSTSFPLRLANEDEGIVHKLDVVIQESVFLTQVTDHVMRPSESKDVWDNGLDFYLNKVYKKVGVKTNADALKGKKTHMFTKRRIGGYGKDSSFDILPPFRPNEIDHNSPNFRRHLAGNDFI